jgi:hypothetical protein
VFGDDLIDAAEDAAIRRARNPEDARIADDRRGHWAATGHAGDCGCDVHYPASFRTLCGKPLALTTYDKSRVTCPECVWQQKRVP